jgi:hypothetical protein
MSEPTTEPESEPSTRDDVWSRLDRLIKLKEAKQ